MEGCICGGVPDQFEVGQGKLRGKLGDWEEL